METLLNVSGFILYVLLMPVLYQTRIMPRGTFPKLPSANTILTWSFSLELTVYTFLELELFTILLFPNSLSIWVHVANTCPTSSIVWTHILPLAILFSLISITKFGNPFVIEKSLYCNEPSLNPKKNPVLGLASPPLSF